jgi:hypothetical protein
MRPILIAMFLFCVGCQSQPGPQAQTASSRAAQAEKPATQRAEQTAPSQKAEPRQFGLRVVSVQPLLCCSDAPGKPTRTGGVVVEGLTPDDWRFVLDCWNIWTFGSESRAMHRATKDEWYEFHTASIEHEEQGDVMTIYVLSPDSKGLPHWKDFVTCSIENRLDQAKDVAPVWVASSEFDEGKSGPGYEVKAWGTHEVYTLACAQGAQSPCVSVAPGWYRGTRNGSEMRLCDQDLKVICAYRIMGERARP